MVVMGRGLPSFSCNLTVRDVGRVEEQRRLLELTAYPPRPLPPIVYIALAATMLSRQNVMSDVACWGGAKVQTNSTGRERAITVSS